jgi:hypothetical protein
VEPESPELVAAIEDALPNRSGPPQRPAV